MWFLRRQSTHCCNSTSPSFPRCTFSTLPRNSDYATEHGNPINKRGPLLHCLQLGQGRRGNLNLLEVPQDWIDGSFWQSALPAHTATCQQYSLLLCCPSSFTLLLISTCGVLRATAHPHSVLPTRAVPSPAESREHISPFFSVHARAVMLTHKVLSSGQPWNIFTLMCSLGAHLAPLIIDLHSSSLVKVQGRSHRPDSHSSWHAERGKTDCCSKETVCPRNQLHVSHRSFTLTFPH